MAYLMMCLILVAILVSLILPWVLWAQMRLMRGELKRLQYNLLASRDDLTISDIIAKEESAPPQKSIESVGKPPPIPTSSVKSIPVTANTHALIRDESEREVQGREEPTVDSNGKQNDELPMVDFDEATDSVAKGDKNWFGKVSIWVGGIALLMASFYLIRFSMESGWMTPEVRITLTTALGFAMCAVGIFFSIRFSNEVNERVGQALSGAGVGTLYFAVYAAVHLYELIGSGAGFAGMASVTLLAVGLSLRHGAPIALLGLSGGFLTPYLMGGESGDTRILFSYLFFLYAGSSILCLRRNWPWLGLFSLLACFAWSGLVIIKIAGGEIDAASSLVLFVLALVVFTLLTQLRDFRKSFAEAGNELRILLGVISIAIVFFAGLAQVFTVVWLRGFTLMDIGIFALIALGAWILAMVREREFGWAAWMGLGAVAMLTVFTKCSGWFEYFGWSAGLSVVFFASAHWMSMRVEVVSIWHRFAIGILPVQFVLAYLNRFIVLDAGQLADVYWLGNAFIWALLLTLAAENLRIRKRLDLRAAAQLHLAAWVVAIAGLWIYLPSSAWIFAAIGIVFVSTLYWSYRHLELASVAFFGAACLWALSVANPAINTINYTLGGDQPLYWDLSFSTMVGLLLSAAVFFTLPRLGRLQFAHAGVSLAASAAALGFGVVFGYAIIEMRWMIPTGVSTPVIEGGLTSLIAIATVVAVWRIREQGYGRVTCWILAGIVGWRIIRFQLFGTGGGGDGLFFNALLLQFGIPLIAALIILHWCRLRNWSSAVAYFQIAAMVIAFLWITFGTRSSFGVDRLLKPISGDGELYVLSLVWLALAVFLQSIGLWRRSSVIHVGSLVLLLVTVAKVFFVDAANLTGLLRVLSFFVLGIALIGIGFFYNKVVFAHTSEKSSDSELPRPRTDIA